MLDVPLRSSPATSPEACSVTEPVASMEPQAEPSQPMHEDPVRPAEVARGSQAVDGEPTAPDPLFDFPARSSTAPPAESAADSPGWFQRSGQRYLLWGSSLMLAALTAYGASWLYGARKDASSLAVVASEYKDEPQRERGPNRRAIAAKEFTLGPNGEVRVSSAPRAGAQPPPQPASPAVPLPAVPKHAPTADARQTAALEPEVSERQASPLSAPERNAGQARKPLTTRAPEHGRERFASRSRPTLAKVERLPQRRLIRASTSSTERISTQNSGMEATLRACREHGYHAAQCVKRACSVTKYGFVCRGR